LTSDNNVTANNNINATSELRHRNRSARQEAMQEKIREIKRKQKESERSLPKKRRSLLILSGVILVLSVFAYVYVKS
jgi:tyrosine-protein phosphatase non-receptor type 1